MKQKILIWSIAFLLVMTIVSAQTSLDFYKENSDVFGLLYETDGGVDDFNSPSANQPIFSNQASADGSKPYDHIDAFMLSKVTYPSGAEVSWDYEVDDWFTSRGDVYQPTQGSFNYYTYWRHPTTFLDDEYRCESNYGGGIRVTAETNCNGLHSSMSDGLNCYTTHYSYTMQDPLIDCDSRSSGAIDFVPLRQATDPAIAQSDQDIRRPSHKGGPYVLSSVIYNQVEVQKGDGSQGSQTYYYTTVDSNPANTDGAISFNAMDDSSGSGVYCTDYQDLGCEANIANNWKRGLEYKVESFNSNGKLVSRLNRFFFDKEILKLYFGDVWREEYYPGIDGSSPSIPGTPDYDKNYAGFASGSFFTQKIYLELFDTIGRDSYKKVIEYEYHPTLGIPVRIIEYNKDLDGNNKNLITDLSLAQEELSNPIADSLNELHIKSLFSNIVESEVGNVLRDSHYTFGIINDAQVVLMNTTYNANNLTFNLNIEDYHPTGRVENFSDAGNNKFYSEYDAYGRLLKVWNSELGSKTNPLDSRTYYPNGLLQSTTNIQGQTITYYYDDFGKLSKIVSEEDTFDSPSIEYLYVSSTSTSPYKEISRAKVDVNKYSETIKFSDGWNNNLQVQTKIDNGNYVVESKVYNNYGELIAEYKPVIANTGGEYVTISWLSSNMEPGQELLSTTYHYSDDIYRRLKTKIFPDGSELHYIYGSHDGFPTITVRDESGEFNRYTYDVLHNNILRVEQGRTIV